MEDVLYWPYSSNGEYSCKTGYRFLKEEAELMDIDRVPTAMEVHLGYVCASKDRTLRDFRSSVAFTDFKQLVLWLVEEGKQLELFAFTAWSVWNQRNKVRVRAPATALHHVAKGSKLSLNDYRSKLLGTETQVQNRSQSSRSRWKPPPVNLVKINFDGAVFAKENKSGIGVVVRDENGLVLGSCSKRLTQAYSAVEVEAMAAATALDFTSEMGVRRAILEGDSLAIIKALREGEQPLSPTGLLLEDVRMFSQRFEKLLYSRTKREGNFVAHSLAKYALNIQDFLVWMEDVPSHIQSFVQANLACLHQ
ncbi:hypothetical protein SO802_018007 [Lithocarpus litseifolius]|uniref:RNase H type-1 domain-containing protein n=1 Tax=Lithocarpus litseifolius TaxID=425828 RepID=A0AAW2CNW8_9ROSI